MKHCTNKNCNEPNPQPLSAFGKNASRPDGLSCHCKSCRKRKAKEDYDDPTFKEHERTRTHGRYFTLHKKNKCETCSFVALDPCQLDVDHIDGDHSNNDPSNLKTLCANCHRLKTKLSKNNRWNK